MRFALVAFSLFAVAACGGTSQVTRTDEPPPSNEPPPVQEPPAPRSCGGMVAGQAGCLEGEFCDFPVEATCGAADGTGVCRSRPEPCTMDYSPVCGCDEHTYSNACGAAAAGVSVSATGECPQRVAAVGETCGTRGALPCADGLFCDFPTGADCGRADAPGACAEKPTTCDERAVRVCGCDGTTYANACEAHMAGVSVERARACPTRRAAH